ncbi:MAG: ATP-binding protein [Sneathiella sp.]
MTAPFTLDRDTHVSRSRADLAELITALHSALDAVASGKQPVLPGPGEDNMLERLVALFGLSEVDRQILLLAVGAELDPTLAERIGTLQGSGGTARADVTTALALLPDGGWEALCSGSLLRRWRFIDVVGRGPFLRREIVLDERIMQHLMAINYLDSRLEGLVSNLGTGPTLSPRQAAVAEKLQAAWNTPNLREWPVILFAGQDALSKRAIMQHVCHQLGLRLYRIDVTSLPDNWAERYAVSILCDRELLLSDAALLIEVIDETSAQAAASFADSLYGPVALLAEDPESPTNRQHRLRIDLAPPDMNEKKASWTESLQEHADTLGDGIEQLSEQFSLDHASMDTAVKIAVDGTVMHPDKLFDRVWSAARDQGRRRLGGLAERIESTAKWENLVLPADQIRQLKELTAHIGQAWKVYQSWGWEQKSSRGLGAAALFSGPSGTGKTLAAEVLATELKLDLYRIDLSQVVSKYIGETEKNLSRIFKAAEDGGAVLLFDEADALFGKRSEVKDSHDRYANVEVSYLLQRMETYRGLTILTTNQKSALDQAFLRRLRFAIAFPFPDSTSRIAIWSQVFPKGTPLDGLDLKRLARMNITGGSIRSIALNASFLAASDDTSVTSTHILRAAQREYAKLEKPFTGSELGKLR